MNRTILIFGILAGFIVSAMLVISVPLMRGNAGEPSPYAMIVGFASMLLAFALIFVAVKMQRDKRQGGAISFGRAFLVGLGVAVIASLCYTITWVIIYKNFYPGFMDDMIAAELRGMTQKGTDASKIATRRAELDAMRQTYSTWPGLIGWTMIEILPLGVLVALIAGLVLKRKAPRRPAQSL